MKELLNKVWNWLKPKLQQLFMMTAKNVAKEVLDIINDAQNQALALEAVKQAATGGLKGNEAFDKALNALSEKLKADGKELSDCIKDTLVQNAYVVFKHGEECGDE